MIVVFTKRAQNHYNHIQAYLDANFGEIVSNEFTKYLSDFINTLINFPKIGRKEVSEKPIYGFQLTKQTRVIYRISGKQIIVLALFDVRQSPVKKFTIFKG